MDKSRTMKTGEKEVLASHPYRPDFDYLPELVGREDEMKKIISAWMACPGKLPQGPLLVGEPGVGKNRLVYEAARRTGKELYILQGHDEVTVEDMAGGARFSDDPDKKLDYFISPLVTAMARGQICFIDEIGKIRPRALTLLVSVLDERRYIDSTLLGECIHAQPGFRFIAATNTADLAGNALPKFIDQRNRPMIRIGYPAKEVIDRIIHTQFPHIGAATAGLNRLFWQLWRDNSPEYPPTPRDAIHIFSFIIGMGGFDHVRRNHPFDRSGPDNPFPLSIEERDLPVTPDHMASAFELFFNGEGKRVAGQSEP